MSLGPKSKNASKPWVSNYPPLQAWLKKIEATCQQQVPVGNARDPVAYLETWITLEGRAFIIEVRARAMGWNIFTASESSMIPETLADAEARLMISVP